MKKIFLISIALLLVAGVASAVTIEGRPGNLYFSAAYITVYAQDGGSCSAEYSEAYEGNFVVGGPADKIKVTTLVS